jgi:hypothetical protein
LLVTGTQLLLAKALALDLELTRIGEAKLGCKLLLNKSLRQVNQQLMTEAPDMSGMNTGKQTIELLYTDLLQVDAAWSIRTANGFTWWTDKNAQTIGILGEEMEYGKLTKILPGFLPLSPQYED